jgi:hypothetical protein
LTFICAKKEREKKKKKKTKQNKIKCFFPKKIGTRIGGSIEQQEPNNIV